MLTIILGILKFIGLLFLVILGVFLIVFFSVLLVPIRYRAQGDYYEKPRLKATVSWLLHIFSLQVSYDGEFSATLRLFGFRLKNLSGRDRAEDSGADREESPELEEPGEVIRRIDERAIDTADALIAAVRSQDFGETVTLEVYNPDRDETRSVDVTLSEE